MASTAWSWIAGPVSMRSHARYTSTTRSIGSSRALESPDEFARNHTRPRTGSAAAGIRRWASLPEFSQRDSAGRRARLPTGPTCSTSPELEALLRAKPESVSERATHRRCRGHRHRRKGPTALLDLTFVKPVPTRQSTSWKPITCLGCDGAQQHCARPESVSAMQDLKFDPALAGRGRGHRCRPQPVGRACTRWCDPVRAGTYMRIGASRYRWEFSSPGPAKPPTTFGHRRSPESRSSRRGLRTLTTVTSN